MKKDECTPKDDLGAPLLITWNSSLLLTSVSTSSSRHGYTATPQTCIFWGRNGPLSIASHNYCGGPHKHGRQLNVPKERWRRIIQEWVELFGCTNHMHPVRPSQLLELTSWRSIRIAELITMSEQTNQRLICLSAVDTISTIVIKKTHWNMYHPINPMNLDLNIDNKFLQHKPRIFYRITG